MADRNPGFEVVGGTETETEAKPEAVTGVQIAMLRIALTALSQRALTAATDLFTILTMASAFWLWSTIPEPNDRQIVSLTIYAALVLAINWIVRRK